MIRIFTLFLFLTILLTFSVSAQTQKDTIYTNYSKTPVVIDGSDADACWATAKWHAIDQVWIPFNEKMKPGDFEGKYKVAWDTNYLYILVQVVDDSLSDVHTDPFDNYWNDDAVELFIDEDRSKGDHLNNNNAFAYHVSIFYDAIDGGNGFAVNCKNNMSVVMDTIGPHTYLWEFAVKMYNASFNINKPEASRVKLYPNKLMGFSIAYCDNDGAADKQRENFIGSMIMPEAHANDNYITADYFGSMLLVDPGNEWVSTNELSSPDKNFSIYPNPASNAILLTVNKSLNPDASVEIINSMGALIKREQIISQKQTIDLSGLVSGIYLVRVTNGSHSETEMIRKQ